jgi:hypothetical protein
MAALDVTGDPLHTPRVSNRLTRFREYMARFDAAASPEHAIERGFYVQRPGRSVADEIAARAELRPASTHLLVGGVGSGKTTQLLMARKRLNQLSDTHSIYIDVSLLHDLGRIRVGVLLVLAGLALSQVLTNGEKQDKRVSSAVRSFEGWGHGYHRLETRGQKSWIKGVLLPPGPPGDDPGDDGQGFSQMREAAKELACLRAALESRIPHILLLIDSLDRLVDPTVFAFLAEVDVAAIHWSGVGVVLVGPHRTMYGSERATVDLFDYFYYQPVVDVQDDTDGADFLTRVLRARADIDILPDVPCRRLAEYSGGVLRDLITLAQAAGEEAYLAGADTIATEHVETAADAFGRKHLLGLGPDELDVLQRVRTKGIFVQTSDKDLALLVTRRVLEYQNGRPRYAVHPTIRPLLEQLAETP